MIWYGAREVLRVLLSRVATKVTFDFAEFSASSRRGRQLLLLCCASDAKGCIGSARRGKAVLELLSVNNCYVGGLSLSRGK